MGASCCKGSPKRRRHKFAVAPLPRPLLDLRNSTYAQLQILESQLTLYREKVAWDEEKLDQVTNECLKQGMHKAKLILKKKRREQSLLCKCDDQIRVLTTNLDKIHIRAWEWLIGDGLKQCDKYLEDIKVLVEDLGDCERILEHTDRGILYLQQLSIHLAYEGNEEDEREIMQELSVKGPVELTPKVRATCVAQVKKTKNVKKFSREKLDTIRELQDQVIEVKSVHGAFHLGQPVTRTTRV